MAWRTGGCAGRCLLSLLLLTASLLDWSLISLVNMVIFFAIRFVAPRREEQARLVACRQAWKKPTQGGAKQAKALRE
uniref:Uncharacterized protein n=1 Tax=Aegilops tauschii TaxID=37682 RepID=M8BD36_AEGTA